MSKNNNIAAIDSDSDLDSVHNITTAADNNNKRDGYNAALTNGETQPLNTNTNPAAGPSAARASISAGRRKADRLNSSNSETDTDDDLEDRPKPKSLLDRLFRRHTNSAQNGKSNDEIVELGTIPSSTKKSPSLVNTALAAATANALSPTSAAATAQQPVSAKYDAAFHQAVRNGDIPTLRNFLNALPPHIRESRVNALDETGTPALHYAARHHNVELARLLIEYGANVNGRDENGQTPLHFACRHKVKPDGPLVSSPPLDDTNDEDDDIKQCSLEISTKKARFAPSSTSVQDEDPAGKSFVAVLSNAGADVNARDYTYCSTPLHVAVIRGNEPIVADLLVLPDIQPDIGDKFQHTPLHLAASAGLSLEIVRLFLAQNSVRLDRLDNNSSTPLHLAAEKGNWDIVRLILEEVRRRSKKMNLCSLLQQRDAQKNTPLMLAVQGGHKSVVRHLLLECDEQVASALDASNNVRETSLHFAAARGDAETCRWLVERGARVDARDAQFQTPLHKAAGQNRLQVVEYLLSAGVGAAIEAIDQNSFTPMLLAARNGHGAMVKRLLELGANIFASSKRERNALHLSAARNHVKVMDKLLDTWEGRAELTTRRDRYGFYPLHSACQKGMLQAVQLLIEKGNARVDVRLEDERTPLHLAAQTGRSEIVDALTDVDYELVNYEDENSDTALHMAALGGFYETCARLIRCGAHVDGRNANMRTPLDQAASRGHTNVCELLLKYDAPVHGAPHETTANNVESATTPLHLACAGGFVDTARLLVERGHASLAARDGNGRNCLDIAIDHAHEACAMYIIQSPAWHDVLRNEQWHHRVHGVVRQTPMRKLIRSMPAVAYEALSRCMETKRRPDSARYKVTCQYEFIDDTFSHWSDAQSGAITGGGGYNQLERPTLADSARPYTTNTRVLKDNHILLIMVRHAREELLMHPLTYSLIHTKWALYGRTVFLISFFAYCLYLALLTGYTMASSPVNRLFYVKVQDDSNHTYVPYWMADACEEPGTHWPLSADINALRDADVCTAIEKYRSAPFNCNMRALDEHAAGQSFMIFFRIGQFVLLCSSICFLFKAVAEFFVLRTIDCVIAGCVYMITIIMTIPWEGFNCFHNYGLTSSWKWQLASFNIFLAYINFVLLLRYLPWIGLYVQMLKDVTQTLLRVFVVFFGIVWAFALSFHVAFKASVRHDQHLARIDNSDGYDHSMGWELNPFYTIPQSLVKTFTMLIGEYEQETHFTKTNLSVTLVVFTLLVLIGSVAVANLLVGLAVSDIKAVQDQATLKRVSMRINYVLSAERLMTWRMRKRMSPTQSVVYPNDKGGVGRNKKKESDGLLTPKGDGKKSLWGVAKDWILRVFYDLVVGGQSSGQDFGARVQETVQRSAEIADKAAREEARSNVGEGAASSSQVLSMSSGDTEIVKQIIDEALTRIESAGEEAAQTDEQKAATNETRKMSQHLRAMIVLQTEMLRIMTELQNKLLQEE